MSLWAREIEKMSPSQRANASYWPYYVTPEGKLQLLTEIGPPNAGPPYWPVGRAPGWKTLVLPSGEERKVWTPLGAEYFWAGRNPLTAHAPPGHPDTANGTLNGARALELVLRGEAFAFDGRFFLLPVGQFFIMNSFKYEVPGMDPLGVFVGYRGVTKQYNQIITPGLFRKRNSSTPEKYDKWQRLSRIASNVLKQRFLEKENSFLTDLEARGILQHHYIIGRTDVLDLTFDINVAKWFALNEQSSSGEYKRKIFVTRRNQTEARQNASCVYTLLVRPIGGFPLIKDGLLQGYHFELHPEFRMLPRNTGPEPQASPLNLAPLISRYPSRQKGFGLHGVFPDEEDRLGSVLGIVEHLFHPTFYPDGWQEIGGPQLFIDGRRYAADEDSSSAQDYLIPPCEEWFSKVIDEVRAVVREIA